MRRHYEAHRVGSFASLCLTAMLLTIAIGACTRVPTPSPMISARLALNGPAGGQQAAFIYADKLGYYADERLDATITEARGSLDAAERVARGQSDFAFADASAIARAQADGGGLTVVSTLFQDSGFAVLSLGARPITSLDALRGQTVGAPAGSMARGLFEQILAANGLTRDVSLFDLRSAEFDRALRLGTVAAVVGRRDVEVLQLRHAAESVVELPFADIGQEVPGLSLAASDDLIQRDPETVRRFVRASLRGWDAARQNPRAAGRAVVEQFLAGYEEEIVEQFNADLQLVCGPRNDLLGMPYTGDGRFMPADAPRCR